MTLEEQIQNLTAELDASNAKCAEMRDVLKEVEWRGSGDLELMRDNFFCPICHAHGADCERLPHDSKCQLQHAISSDCGKGYHHDDEWKMVVEALKKVRTWLVRNTDIVEHNPLLDDEVIPALTHAERLTGKDK